MVTIEKVFATLYKLSAELEMRRVLYVLKADAENLGHWIEAHGKSCAKFGEPYTSTLWKILFCCMTVLQNTRPTRLIPLALFQLSFRPALIAVEVSSSSSVIATLIGFLR